LTTGKLAYITLALCWRWSTFDRFAERDMHSIAVHSLLAYDVMVSVDISLTYLLTLEHELLDASSISS
jgi:hypothetical protein